MSFNTSNIQADTFTGSVSLSAPIHYVAGIPISKNEGNLKLGDVDNAVVECLELESGTSVTAPLGEFDLVQTSGLISQAGLGEPIQVYGSLNLSNYSLNNVNSLTLANGATGAENQVLSIGATGALFWKTDTAGDVSQWATFPAVSTVNLGAQSLNGTYDKGEGINVITGLIMNNKSITGVSTLTTGFIQGTTGAFINLKDLVNIEGNVAGGFGIKNLETLSLLGGLTGTAGQVLAVGATGNLEWKDDATGDVSQWATFDAVQDVNINNFALNSVQSISGYDGNNILLNNTLDMNYNNITTITNINCEKLLCQYRPDKIYYVSSNGSNTSGLGNIEAPFLTIQHALDYVNGDENNNYYYIIVLPGNYVENLTITKKVHLIGMATSPFSSSIGCSISGSITINVGSNGGDMFNNAVNISGFLIGSQVSFISTENSILNINDCFIYTDDNTSGRGLYFNPTCVNSRLRITNTIIQSGGSAGLDPLIEITSVSQTTMNNCYFSAKGLQNVLKFSGTATCDTINTVKFESGNAGANVPEIVSITATNSGTYTFSNCGFLYGSATNKTANPTSSGIRCSPSSGNPRVVILYCSFFLLGTNTAQYAVEDANHAQPNQMIVLYYMNGASLQNAFAIHANNNQNKFQLQVVS
jgi:hypothetical protein